MADREGVLSWPAVQPGDVVAQRFVVESRTGAGGMGRIYRARDLQTGEPVALKMLAEGVAMPDCPGAMQECLPWFEMGQALPGLENVGICGIPQ